MTLAKAIGLLLIGILFIASMLLVVIVLIMGDKN